MYTPLARQVMPTPWIGYVTYFPRRVGQQTLPIEIEPKDQTIIAKVTIRNVGPVAGNIDVWLRQALTVRNERKTIYLEPGQTGTLTFNITFSKFNLDPQQGNVIKVLWEAAAGDKVKSLYHDAFLVKKIVPPPTPVPEFVVEYTPS